MHLHRIGTYFTIGSAQIKLLCSAWPLWFTTCVLFSLTSVQAHFALLHFILTLVPLKTDFWCSISIFQVIKVHLHVILAFKCWHSATLAEAFTAFWMWDCNHNSPITLYHKRGCFHHLTSRLLLHHLLWQWSWLFKCELGCKYCTCIIIVRIKQIYDRTVMNEAFLCRTENLAVLLTNQKLPTDWHKLQISKHILYISSLTEKWLNNEFVIDHKTTKQLLLHHLIWGYTLSMQTPTFGILNEKKKKIWNCIVKTTGGPQKIKAPPADELCMTPMKILLCYYETFPW